MKTAIQVNSFELLSNYYSHRVRDYTIFLRFNVSEITLLGEVQDTLFGFFTSKEIVSKVQKHAKLRGHYVLCLNSIKQNKIVLVESTTGETYELKNLNILL